MATRKSITLRTALASTALLGFVAAPAQAGPIPSLYHLTFGADFVPEQISVPHAPYPADPFAGFTTEAVGQFLADQGVVTFDVSISGRIANDAGYVLGQVSGFAMPGTPLFFYGGQVICCAIDWPYRLNAVNDSGIFVGHSEMFAFIGSDISSFWVTPEIPNLDAASIADLEIRYGDDTPWQFFWWSAEFTAIDNANRIGGNSPLGNFVLEPVSVSEVPEPSSWMLLAGALGWFLWLLSRHRRRTTLTPAGQWTVRRVSP